MRSFLLTKIGILFVLTFLLGSTDIVAQEEGRAEVYTMADTVRAKVMLEEALKFTKERQFEEALNLAYQAKDIFIQLFREEGYIGISDAWYIIGSVYF
ncbi:MAG: hypothetical protein Q7U74_12015, partial [Saprospiraceae bacterium]|nr:hypothetical protein [Saprospiraceae bacterium]